MLQPECLCKHSYLQHFSGGLTISTFYILKHYLSHITTFSESITRLLSLQLGMSVISFAVATVVMLDSLTYLLALFRKGIVSGFGGGMMLATELNLMLPGGFGFGYSSMRIHLLPFAMLVAKLSSMLSSPNGFMSGLMSGLTSGGTSASNPGVFFKGVITGVGQDVRCCTFLLPCTCLFLGLGPVSVVENSFFGEVASLVGGRGLQLYVVEGNVRLVCGCP